MPEVTEEQILEYIRLIELAREEFEGIRTDPIEAATDPYEYANLPDEDAVRKAASILNYEDARIRGMLDDDMRAKLQNAGPSMQFTEHGDSFYKHQPPYQPPGLEDLRIDPTKKGSGQFTMPAGGYWHGLGNNWSINPAWLLDNPETGRPYWESYEGRGAQGTAEGVVGHELGGHGTDDAMAENTTPKWHKWTTPFLREDGTVGRRGYLKAGTGRNFWSQVDAFGKEFMSRGAARIQDADDEAVRGGRPGSLWDDPTKSPSVNAKERYAGLMMHIFDTGVVPTSFGNEFYEFVKGFIPNVKQEYLGLDKVDPHESPHEAFVRLRKERDEGTGTTDREVEQAWKKFIFSVDSRDEAAGLYDTGKARYVKAEGGPLDGFESGEWTSDTMAKPHGDISGKWTPVVAKPDLDPAKNVLTDRDKTDTELAEAALGDNPRRHSAAGWPYSGFSRYLTIPKNVSLSEISENFDISIPDLLTANKDIKNADDIIAGNTLRLPPLRERSQEEPREEPPIAMAAVMDEITRKMELKMQYEAEARGQWAQRFGTPEMEASMMDPDFEDFVARVNAGTVARG